MLSVILFENRLTSTASELLYLYTQSLFMQEYFQQLNKYYDKIYVLSVEAAAERRELFARRFKGLDYSFFFGAEKNKFTVEETIATKIFSEELTQKHHRYGKTMRPGEIACAWSHKMMYEEIIEKNYNRVLIFEDDAVPDENRMKQMQAILNEIPVSCELLMWGWAKNEKNNIAGRIKQFVYHFQYQLGFLKWNHRIIRNLYARPFTKHLKKAGFHDFTYAYAISKTGAEKLLKMQTPIQYVADNLLAHAAANEVLDSYVVYPQVFLHDTLPDGTARDSYIR